MASGVVSDLLPHPPLACTTARKMESLWGTFVKSPPAGVPFAARVEAPVPKRLLISLFQRFRRSRSVAGFHGSRAKIALIRCSTTV